MTDLYLNKLQEFQHFNGQSFCMSDQITGYCCKLFRVLKFFFFDFKFVMTMLTDKNQIIEISEILFFNIQEFFFFFFSEGK